MIVGIVGSRSIRDYEWFKSEVAKHLPEHIDMIVSGGAEGVDQMARRYANENNIPCTEYFPKWEQYGREAGLIRNHQIVAASDMILAFWDGVSRGTMHTVSAMKRTEKPVLVITREEVA